MHSTPHPGSERSRPADVSGRDLYGLAEELFPLHRAITGAGVRETLDLLSKWIPLQRIEVPTGTKVFDWTIPPEWRIRDAYIARESGERVVDYRCSNLHVVNYSTPVQARMDWESLKPFVHWVPQQPDAVPYRTAYFRDGWGFCVDHQQYALLRDGGPWQVVIDADFFDGSLSIAECEITGQTADTFLIYCHTCHPSLANDNLSGIAVATFLARNLQTRKLRYNYRIVFAPATIGAIAWMASQPLQRLQEIKAGLVLTLLGDGAPFTYKESLQDSIINRLAPQVLRASGVPHEIRPFAPTGYDERQFASPGIRLPIGRLSRSNHGEFREYHTSADNLDLIRPEHLLESYDVCTRLVEVLEANTFPVNQRPYGEPQLGKRGLFRAFGEHDDRGRIQEAMMWVLCLADGSNDLLAIAERSGIGWNEIQRASDLLTQHALLEQHDQANPNAMAHENSKDPLR